MEKKKKKKVEGREPKSTDKNSPRRAAGSTRVGKSGNQPRSDK